MGDGRLMSTLHGSTTNAVDPTDVPRVPIVRPAKRQPMQALALICDTFCSLCSAPRITEGVRIWSGRGKFKPPGLHHIICMRCALAIGRAAKEAP